MWKMTVAGLPPPPCEKFHFFNPFLFLVYELYSLFHPKRTHQQLNMNYNVGNKTSNNISRSRQLIDLEETFLMACRENDRTKVRACLDLGVNVNAKNISGWFGLMWAAFHNFFDLCKMLLGQMIGKG